MCKVTESHKGHCDTATEGDSHCTGMFHDDMGHHGATHALKDKKKVASPIHRISH